MDELKKLNEGTVVIRSLGVPKEIYDILEKQHINIVDATCPFVKKTTILSVRKQKRQGDYNNRQQQSS